MFNKGFIGGLDFLFYLEQVTHYLGVSVWLGECKVHCVIIMFKFNVED